MHLSLLDREADWLRAHIASALHEQGQVRGLADRLVRLDRRPVIGPIGRARRWRRRRSWPRVWHRRSPGTPIASAVRPPLPAARMASALSHPLFPGKSSPAAGDLRPREGVGLVLVAEFDLVPHAVRIELVGRGTLRSVPSHPAHRRGNPVSLFETRHAFRGFSR
jgi:hypothetical protein